MKTLRALSTVALGMAVAGIALASPALAHGKHWNAAFTSKTYRTGCEARVNARHRVYVTCAQQVPTRPGRYNEHIPYLTLYVHGRASKQRGGLANLEETAAVLPYDRWLWPDKMTSPTRDGRPQYVPRLPRHAASVALHHSPIGTDVQER